MDHEPLLQVEDLRVRYGAVEVVKGIGFQIRAGEIVALIGANGAGKTTTLMALSGLAPMMGGSIRFAGQALEGLSSEARVRGGITQVPEGRRIFPNLTVHENLLMGSCLRRDAQAVAEDLRFVFGLFPILNERSQQLGGTLSGGEQQMLAIARGLMSRPKLLLLDEPSLGLAPRLVTQLFALIRQIQSHGVTILLVEQNAYQALQAADRGYVLEAGRIALTGPAQVLREDPAVKRAYLGG
ncbi:MAG: ABC transporter ATP-binding protein [Candidatus Omnitrophica bacterium]|nr:ABC transporter ATP-binding protein [Candidatus Omnitrophota bacterium]